MPLEIERIRALCFDVDGTLSDTDDQYARKFARWLSPFAFALPKRDPRPLARKIVMFSETPGNFLLGIPDRLGVDKPLADLADFFFRRGHGPKSGGFLLIPGVREALERLRERFPLSVVSARGQQSTQMFLDQFDLNPFFQAIATAHTCKYTKPYPHPIVWVAAKMGVQPAQCLMIGDTTVDIRAARAAGAQSVGVLCGFGEEAELRRAGADLILAHTALLADVLLAG